MHDHLEEREGRDAHVLEVDGVIFPGFGVLKGLLLVGVIGVEVVAGRVDQLYSVFELYRMSARARAFITGTSKWKQALLVLNRQELEYGKAYPKLSVDSAPC